MAKKIPELEGIKEYRAWLTNRRLSPHTIKAYTYWYNRLLWETEDREEDLQGYLERHRKPVVRAFIISLCKYKKKGIRLEKVGRTPRRLPQYFPPEKEGELINRQGMIKYRVLFWMLSECGLRISEAMNIRHDDIKSSEEPPRIFITGKGNKEAFIYPSRALIEALQALERKEANPYVFYSPEERREGKPLTTNTARYHLKKVDRGAYPHKFRHTFAKRQLEAGENLPTIKELLRHSDISTTSIYTQIDNKEVQRAAKNTHRA